MGGPPRSVSARGQEAGRRTRVGGVRRVTMPARPQRLGSQLVDIYLSTHRHTFTAEHHYTTRTTHTTTNTTRHRTRLTPSTHRQHDEPMSTRQPVNTLCCGLRNAPDPSLPSLFGEPRPIGLDWPHPNQNDPKPGESMPDKETGESGVFWVIGSKNGHRLERKS